MHRAGRDSAEPSHLLSPKMLENLFRQRRVVVIHLDDPNTPMEYRLMAEALGRLRYGKGAGRR